MISSNDSFSAYLPPKSRFTYDFCGMLLACWDRVVDCQASTVGTTERLLELNLDHQQSYAGREILWLRGRESCYGCSMLFCYCLMLSFIRGELLSPAASSTSLSLAPAPEDLYYDPRDEPGLTRYVKATVGQTGFSGVPARSTDGLHCAVACKDCE